MAALSLAGTSRQSFCALSAATMARSVSALPHIGTVPSFSPFAGLVTSIVLPLSAAIHWPAT